MSRPERRPLEQAEDDAAQPDYREGGTHASRHCRSGNVSRLSSMNRNDRAITTAASGTFRKNAARQLTCWISQPPATGPIAAVIALKPDHVPIARPAPHRRMSR